MKKVKEYHQMTIEELKEIAQPLYCPEVLENNLLYDNPAIKKNNLIPGKINHIIHNKYLYCIYVTLDAKPIGVVEISDAKIYGIYILPEFRNKGIGTELLKDAKKYASEIYGVFVPEMVNKIWRFYHE